MVSQASEERVNAEETPIMFLRSRKASYHQLITGRRCTRAPEIVRGQLYDVVINVVACSYVHKRKIRGYVCVGKYARYTTENL